MQIYYKSNRMNGHVEKIIQLLFRPVIEGAELIVNGRMVM